MLKGTYVFKQGGVEVGRSENIITTNGKTAILQYLSGALSEWAASIAVGTINTTPTVNDLTLAYEVARSAVTLKSFQVGSPNLIVVKGTLAASVAANIYEVGVFPVTTANIFGTRDQLIIDDFSGISNWKGTYTTNQYAAQNSISPRIGTYSVNIPAATTISNSNFYLNLSSYSQLDSLNILANVPSGSSGTLNVVLTDVSSNTAIVSYTFNGATTSGYQILSGKLPSNISTLGTITSVSIQTVGVSSSITVDAIKVSVLGEITNSAGIVSRSVLTTPIAKIYGVPLDIEYYLQLS